MKRLLLHAPNVHTGGGLVLLQDLLREPELPLAWLSVDVRAVDRLSIPTGTDVRPVRRSAVDRFAAELVLCRTARTGDVVICFHGLPPLLPSRAHVIVFLQNRNYLGINSLRTFSGWTRIRIALERFISLAFRGNVDEYLVQSPSMARLVTAWHHDNPTVRVVPFLDKRGIRAEGPGAQTRRYDFVYVADGEAHKNHRILLQAWVLLAHEGFRPSLALTLGARHRQLAEEFKSATTMHGMSIDNVGEVGRDGIMGLYARSRALIYPSTSESFAIPLVEATTLGLAILAPELDYVRDVAAPVQTFDPVSPVSIARAVKRFLGAGEKPLTIVSPTEFVEVLKRVGVHDRRN